MPKSYRTVALLLLLALALSATTHALRLFPTTNHSTAAAGMVVGPAGHTWFVPNKPLQFSLVLETEADVERFALVDSIPINASNPALWHNFNLLRHNETVFYTRAGNLVPALEGRHVLFWGSSKDISFTMEISCSDGIICNGMERLVWNARLKSQVCQASKTRLCDDGNKCTQDSCLARGICSFRKLATLNKKQSSQCKSCKKSLCKPKCGNGLNCGFDGCFGECGTCADTLGTLCASNKCTRSDGRLGTCLNPIPLNVDFRDMDFVGTVTKQVPTELALDVIVPRCEITPTSFSKVPEVIFSLDLPQGQGYTALEVRTRSKFAEGEEEVDVRSTLVILEADPRDETLAPREVCLSGTFKREAQWACETDVSDVNSWSKAATWMLKPGFNYFIAVEREHLPASTVTAQFRLTKECTPNCDEKQCGDSGCPGVTCGECDAENAPHCLPQGVCSVCLPVCNQNTTCGESDQCGGICLCENLNGDGEEDDEALALAPRVSSRIKPKQVCDPFLPQCTHTVKGGQIRPGCKTENEFCSNTCECIPLSRALPDLSLLAFTVTVDDDYIVASNETCAFQEGCLTGQGPRRLLRFETNVFNQGKVTFTVPNPPEKYPDLFEFAPCHGHWHLLDFLLYEVLDEEGNVVAVGEKRSFCLMDTRRVSDRPDAPCTGVYTCARQGLSPGWTDEYDTSLDCQFIDVTGVPAGTYTVRQCVNPKRIFLESSFENNCVDARVTLGPTRAPVTSRSPTQFPTHRECAPECGSNWPGDGICDMQCNVEACDFDGGDCVDMPTCGTAGCLVGFVGDGYCDQQCMQEACGFDGGDCESKSPTSRPTRRPARISG